MVNALSKAVLEPFEEPVEDRQKKLKSPAKFNFFTSPERILFPAIIDGRVPTEEFLNAFWYLTSVYELLGPLFEQVTRIDRSHLQVVRKFYEKDPRAHKYIKEMLLAEKAKGKKAAAVYLSFVVRTMKLLNTLLQNAYSANERGEKIDLNTLCYESYKEHIQRYQNFFHRQLFKTVMLMFLPGIDNFVKYLNFGETPESLSAMLEDAKRFLVNVGPLIEYIENFYIENDLPLHMGDWHISLFS